MNFLHNLLYVEKKEGVSCMGMVWKRYSSLGSTFIFKIAILPNQENGPACHFCRSFWMDSRIGKKFSLNVSVSLVGILMPRYVIAWGSQQNGKLCLHCVTISFGNEMLRALDLEKFICKFERDLKSAKSFKRFEMVLVGSVRKSKISSAYAATLYCFFYCYLLG